MKPATKKSVAKAPPARTATRQLSPRNRGSQLVEPDDQRLQTLFAANVRLVRKARALSQEALADLADLDRTYISSTERNRRNVSLGSIQRIADALSVDVRVLFDPQLSERDALRLVLDQDARKAQAAKS